MKHNKNIYKLVIRSIVSTTSNMAGSMSEHESIDEYCDILTKMIDDEE